MIYFLDEVIEPIEKPFDYTTIAIMSITLFVVVTVGIICAVLLKKNNKKEVKND